MKWADELGSFSSRLGALVAESNLLNGIGFEIAIEYSAALLTGFLGWLFAMRATRNRQRSRLVDELILSQREIAKRAYPDDFGGEWRMDAPREEWMLKPFIDRLLFLSANIAEERAISPKARLMVELYIERVVDFVSHWSNASKRAENYEYLFLQTHTHFEKAALELGLRDMSRKRGTLPRRFEMRLVLGGRRRRRSPTTGTIPNAAE